MDPDNALLNLNAIYNDFSEFCSKRGQVSEADTRSKVIDRILKEALGWPEGAISREQHVHEGYIDYSFHLGKRSQFVVEAKREGIPFDVPISFKSKRRYKISGSIVTNKAIKEAVEQVHYYCVEKGIRYAVTTNGYAWLVFRAIREDGPWRDGDMLVFATAGLIKNNFVEFWNLLSYEAVSMGSLDKAFSSEITVTTESLRPLDLLREPDTPLHRNRFHMSLRPFVEGIFRDISAREQIDLLEKCYVYNRKLRVVDHDLKLVIEDSIPLFMINQGAIDTNPGHHDAGPMGHEITALVSDGRPFTLLLLGGIGAGKTTYLHRFFKIVGKPFMEDHGLWFLVDFLMPPDEHELELHINATVLEQLRKKYGEMHLESRENLLAAYEDKIAVLKEAILNSEQLSETEYNKRLNGFIEKWISDINDYVPRLIKTARSLRRTTVICIDNVDQLAPAFQARIFHTAHKISKQTASIVILSLREESYHAPSMRKAFTAYNINCFHIASPPFLLLLSLRLKYCREMLSLPDEQVIIKLGTGLKFDRTEVEKFFKIIEYSVFSTNKNIVRFIEAIAFGNMRVALEMFATFIYSGTTNVDKMLKIYDREGRYFVPFHEFAKSVMLGDRKYYRDSVSKILNLFERGQDRNSSHFTRLRLLSLLLAHAGDMSREGRGFVSLDDLFNSFIDIFDNEHDLIKALTHLLNRQLLQLDTRSTDSLNGASYIRVSTAGWYYFKYLVRSFAYLDLVLQDTPIYDNELANMLKQAIVDGDQVPDTQEYIVKRTNMRFDRVEAFLAYLEGEEQKERTKFSLDRVGGNLGQSFMIGIRDQYLNEKNWIVKRISENMEKQADDSLEFDSSIPDILPEENDEENPSLF